jgi:hypothetical protein
MLALHVAWCSLLPPKKTLLRLPKYQGFDKPPFDDETISRPDLKTLRAGIHSFG